MQSNPCIVMQDFHNDVATSNNVYPEAKLSRNRTDMESLALIALQTALIALRLKLTGN